MMKKLSQCFGLMVLATALLTACATQGTLPPAFDAQPVAGSGWDKKVDHLVFILDASSSMSEDDQGQTKFDTARNVIDHFNQTMPAMNFQVSLRTFGHHSSVSSRSAALMVEPQSYTRSVLAKGLEKVSKAGGISPLERAMQGTATDLEEVKAPIALIIVSDGKDMSKAPLAAAQALKAAHGDRLCIYTVLVGDLAAGQVLLAQIAETAGCGRALTAGGLAGGAAMNAFVKEVLLAQKTDSDGDGVVDDRDQCPDTPRGVKVDAVGCPLDSDGDGVLDYKDQCPGTPRGTEVDVRGCPIPVASKSAEVTETGTWIYKDIQFENNKADLRDSAYPTLNEITDALKAQPGLKIEIQGHTDITGSREYNLGLSQRRAQSVKSYLEIQGIEPSRMTTIGYGPDRPIDTNATSEGRARNRRVEIKPLQ